MNTKVGLPLIEFSTLTSSRYRRVLITLQILTLISLSVGCRQSSSSEHPKDHSTIKIGFFGDLSGPTFNFGESAKNGLLMAADEINQGGGIDGRRIDVVIDDDGGSPEKAATLTGKLIDQDKVVAIIAGGTSGNSRAAAPKAQSAKTPFISPSSTDPAVTQVGDYIFRACFVDAFQGEVMARFAANTLKAKKAAILFDFNSPYGRGLTDYFELSFSKLGGQIVSKLSYTQGDVDFKGQLSTLQSSAPDVIYIPGYYGDVAVIAKQARMIGLTQPLLGADGWDAPELWQLGGDALNGSFITTHYSVDDPSPAIQRFVNDYKQRYGNLLPDAHAALAYDAMRVLVDAIARARTTEATQLRDALAKTKGFAGVTGVISMDPDRNAVKPAVVLRLQDARYIYQETIQPEMAVPSPSPSPSSTKKK
ncbi:MAG TPA: ABC transporter substrate-binding protein [Pyrinomonadaceae bacterium]|jgi:ABC-type branched-chain amino acid transport systems, periplasmic component|nr:ABC transporter substrate-binding protein [Pyrinomonadaceae bacterium]